jgi:hypothetical protein
MLKKRINGIPEKGHRKKSKGFLFLCISFNIIISAFFCVSCVIKALIFPLLINIR